MQAPQAPERGSRDLVCVHDVLSGVCQSGNIHSWASLSRVSVYFICGVLSPVYNLEGIPSPVFYLTLYGGKV